jgi:hypothetical protein
MDDRQLQKRFEEIPEDLATALASTELLENMRRVCRNYSLSQKDAAAVELLVTLTFLGEFHVNNFPEELDSIVDVPSDITESLADDLGRVVFSPYMDDLKVVGDKYARNIEPGTEEERVDESISKATEKVKEPSEDPSIRQHILEKIEHPQLSPLKDSPRTQTLMSPARSIPTQAKPIETPTARFIVPQNARPLQNQFQTSTTPSITRAYIKPSPEASLPKEAPSILLSQTETPVHNLDIQPELPDHHEDLMPLIIQNSREQLKKENGDPYRESIQ